MKQKHPVMKSGDASVFMWVGTCFEGANFFE